MLVDAALVDAALDAALVDGAAPLVGKLVNFGPEFGGVTDHEVE